MKHRVYPDTHTAWCVTYWKGNVASDAVAADRAKIELNGIFPPVIDLPYPQGSETIENICRALRFAHEMGERYRARQIHDLLTK